MNKSCSIREQITAGNQLYIRTTSVSHLYQAISNPTLVSLRTIGTFFPNHNIHVKGAFNHNQESDNANMHIKSHFE